MAYPGISKKQGRDFNYFKKVTCTWTQFGAPDGYTTADGYGPDLIIPFETQGFSIMNEDTSTVIQVSYNGTTVHDEINPSIVKILTYDNRRNSLIWFRLKDVGSCVVSVRAWSIP